MDTNTKDSLRGLPSTYENNQNLLKFLWYRQKVMSTFAQMPSRFAAYFNECARCKSDLRVGTNTHQSCTILYTLNGVSFELSGRIQ